MLTQKPAVFSKDKEKTQHINEYYDGDLRQSQSEDDPGIRKKPRESLSSKSDARTPPKPDIPNQEFFPPPDDRLMNALESVDLSLHLFVQMYSKHHKISNLQAGINFYSNVLTSSLLSKATPPPPIDDLPLSPKDSAQIDHSMDTALVGHALKTSESLSSDHSEQITVKIVIYQAPTDFFDREGFQKERFEECFAGGSEGSFEGKVEGRVEEKCIGHLKVPSVSIYSPRGQEFIDEMHSIASSIIEGVMVDVPVFVDIIISEAVHTHLYNTFTH